MANSVMTITIVGSDKDPAAAVAARQVGQSLNPVTGVELLRDYLERCNSGMVPGAKVMVFLDQGDGTAATGNIACVQATVTTGDTVTIDGTVFTIVASNPSADPSQGQYVKGASNTTCALNLGTAINAHPRLKGLILATPAVGNCALAMLDKGTHGNLAVIAKAGTGSAGFTLTQFTGGAKGTVQSNLRCFRRGL